MGKIKKILENELVGGTQSTDVYPVTSVKAVYDEDNERLDHILARRGTINVSTNYNTDHHTAEVLTLSGAVAKVPSADRVLGFTMTFNSSDGWKMYQFTGDSVSSWGDLTYWEEIIKTPNIVNDIGDSEVLIPSQKELTAQINGTKAQSIFTKHFDYKSGDKFSNIPFKVHLRKGERITSTISNVSVSYNGQVPKSYAFALKDKYNNYYNTLYSEGALTYEAINDIDIVGIQISINVGIETLSADIAIEYGELISQFREAQQSIKEISALKDSLTSFESLSYNLEKDNGITTVDFYGNFKTGYPLRIEVEDFVTSGGECNVHIYDVDNNTNIVSQYSNGHKDTILVKDSSHIRLELGYASDVNTLSAKAKVVYGSAVTGINNEIAIQNNTDNIGKLKSLIRDTFSLSIDNKSKLFLYDFKKGDVIKLSVSNLSYSGSGAMAIYVADETENVYTLDFNSQNVPDYSAFVVLKRDCSSIRVGISAVNTITAMNADFVVESIPNKIAELKANYERESGYWYKSLNYSEFVNGLPLYINYPFKAKELLVLVVHNVKTELSHYSITVRADKTNLITINREGYDSCAITGDMNKIAIILNDNTSNFTCDIELLYGEEARKYIKEQNELPFLDVEEEVFSKNGTVTDWVYQKKAYVGYKQPFMKDCIIKSLQISSFDSTSDNIGKSYNFVIGTIDQRNWLLPRISFTSTVTQVRNGVLSFDFADSIIAKEGEVLFIEMTAITGSSGRNDVLCGLSSDTYNANNPFMSTKDLDTALSEIPGKGCSYYTLKFVLFESIFAQKGEITLLQNQINSLQNQLNASGIYKDVITGERYQIVISNGTIIPQLLNIKSMLVIGHSFVNYGNSPEAGWYLDDGENRAMAASVNEHQWTSLIKNKLGLNTLKLVSGVDFERNYSTDYDFASKWKVTDVYDAICIYLCENAVYNDTMQESWEAMLNYLKSAAPKARIFCTGSWSSNNKQQAIQAACENTLGVTYVNMLPVSSQLANHSSAWYRGDYYYGRESTYYPIGAPSSHPNDKGMLDIANTFLDYMGLGQIEGKTHSITLNQVSGGIIGTPNVEWLENGIVTIRCTPDSGHSIQSVSVQKSSGGSIEVTRRTNNYYDNKTERVYYTFTMPNEDVVVTPAWGV